MRDRENRESLAAGQALLTVLILAGVILGALVYTAANYVGAGVIIAGIALSIYFLARHEQAAKPGRELQRIAVRAEESEELKYRTAA